MIHVEGFKVLAPTVTFISYRSSRATQGHSCCSLQNSLLFCGWNYTFLLSYLWWPGGMGQWNSRSFNLQFRVSLCMCTLNFIANVTSSRRHDMVPVLVLNEGLCKERGTTVLICCRSQSGEWQVLYFFVNYGMEYKLNLISTSGSVVLNIVALVFLGKWMV